MLPAATSLLSSISLPAFASYLLSLAPELPYASLFGLANGRGADWRGAYCQVHAVAALQGRRRHCGRKGHVRRAVSRLLDEAGGSLKARSAMPRLFRRRNCPALPDKRVGYFY